MGIAEGLLKNGKICSTVQMKEVLERQKQAHIQDGPPSAQVRINRIDRAIALLIDNKEEICEALRADFGHRSAHQSLLADVFAPLGELKAAKKALPKWMRAEKRKTMFPLNLTGARSRVEYQPLGTVGVISPWNFPVLLTFAPMAGILAAGNRVMIKPSEFTPATSALMARMFESAFDETEIAVFPGGPEVGQAFSGLAFDHLLFTGATSVGRHVMRAAAENLVPVTLELGGKSPVIIGKSAKMEAATDRIMNGKMMNAGQICLAPDYIFVAEDQVDDFVKSSRRSVAAMYPTLKDNEDYTSVINQRHFDRLQSYITDARAKGAKVVEINPANEDFSQQPAYKIPPTLLLDVTEDMKVMQDEIFGPLLPVKTYKKVSDAIGYINGRPRPLGLYYFGEETEEKNRVLNNTTSGGACVNEVMVHAFQEDLPFGGVGPSGMNSYHGFDGFRTFSHAKAVFEQGKLFDLGPLTRPPFTSFKRKMVASQIKR